MAVVNRPLIVLWVVVAAAVVKWYAGERWLAVATTGQIEGAIVATWIASAWLLGKRLFPFINVRNSSRALAFATTAALGLGVFGLVALALGLLALLNCYTTIALLLAGPLLYLPAFIKLLKTKANLPEPRFLRVPASSHWPLLFTAPLVAMMFTGATIVPGILWKPDDPHPYDALEYHLQVPREWMEAGRITPLHHNVFSYFPFATEMHYLMAMHLRGGPWEAMYQCQFMSFAWTVLGAIAIYGVVRGPASGRPLLASAAALLALSTPWTIMLGSVAYTESALAFYTVLATIWILKALTDEQSNPTRAMLIAAGLAGLACGVKYTAVPMVLIPLGLTAFVVSSATRRLRTFWKPTLLYFALAAAVASPWLIRNYFWTGNPVFPLAMKHLGHAHFDSVQVERFQRAHSPPPDQAPFTNRLKRFSTEILTGWQFGYALWIAGAAAILLALRNRAAIVLLLYLVMTATVWLAFTHLLGRFFVFAIPVTALLIGIPHFKWWPALASILAVGAALICIDLIHPRLQKSCDLAQYGFFGLDDISFLAPHDVIAAEEAGETVTLIGDAEAFLYRIPTTRLKYRTVFDIPGNQTDIWQAWTGAPESQATGTTIINPMEVARLASTYFGLPGLPANFPYDRDRTTTVRSTPPPAQSSTPPKH